MFMKAVPWSEPSGVNGVYSLGRAHVGIYVTLMHGGDMTVYQEPENKTNKITVAGTEVVYNDIVKDEVSYHYLTSTMKSKMLLIPFRPSEIRP